MTDVNGKDNGVREAVRERSWERHVARIRRHKAHIREEERGVIAVRQRVHSAIGKGGRRAAS
jgi:hypothetical protein